MAGLRRFESESSTLFPRLFDAAGRSCEKKTKNRKVGGGGEGGKTIYNFKHRIAKTAGMIVLNSGGVVRGYTNWGSLLLPARAKKHQATHHFGHYFIMRFDSSGKTQQVIRTTLGLDPRMVKFSVIKLGHRLDQVDKVGGKEWKFSFMP